MQDEHGEGSGPKRSGTAKRLSQPRATTPKQTHVEVENLGQIEYLIFQSTQGVHLAFDNDDVTRVLSKPCANADFYTEENRTRIQKLLTQFLDAESLEQKRSLVRRLPNDDHELLIRAYFRLVENMILSHSTIRH